AREVGVEPRLAGRLVARRQHAPPLAVDVDHGDPAGADHPGGVLDAGRQQGVDLGGPDELGGRLEDVDPGVVAGAGDVPHLLDGHPVDLTDLADQQVDQRRVGQLDHQLVDRLATAPLEDVDAHDVAPDGTDPAGDLAEGTRPVGKPQADHEGLHVGAPYAGVVNRLFRLGDSRVSWRWTVRDRRDQHRRTGPRHRSWDFTTERARTPAIRGDCARRGTSARVCP